MHLRVVTIVIDIECDIAVALVLFVNITAEEVQKKVKGIRVQYTRERQKSRKCRSGEGAKDIYTSKWIHYSKLGFLDDFITPKQSVSNYNANMYRYQQNIKYLHNSMTNKHC